MALNADDATPVTQPVVDEPTPPLRQAVGSFAVGYVGAWLSATQADSTALTSYISTNVPFLAQVGFEYRNAAVASIEEDPSLDLATVVVGADVKDDTVESGKGNQWPRRYFQVVIATAQEALAPIGLPAPVTGPLLGNEPPALDYTAQIASNSSAGKTVTAFLAAYLSGQGATEPYTTPTTSIPAITPAPYVQLNVTAMSSRTPPTEQPADGDAVAVYATVTATTAAGQQATSNYTLDLRARGGRWEVAALGGLPALAEQTTPIPTPSATSGTERGN